jgi:ABC superfamily ATP binding cassette transporter, membrane protein
MGLMFENFKMALSSVKANKMRAFLTMLGIIIGISSVMTITSIGNAVSDSLDEAFKGFGKNRIIVFINYANDDIDDSKLFSLEDIENIKEELGDLVSYFAPFNSYEKEVKNGRRKAKISFVSADTTYIRDMTANKIIYGRNFKESDIKGRKNVVIVNRELATKLFGKEDVVGEHIETEIEGTPRTFTIIGVYNKNKSIFDALTGSDSTQGFIPYTLSTEDFYGLNIKINEEKDMKKGTEKIKKFLAKYKRVNDDVYSVESVEDQANQINGVMAGLSLGLGAIAAISLLVGGIGIMNIMLVSVTERTKEIGIRKSLGARRRDILTQFMVESAILSLSGGLIGIIIGFGISSLAGMFLPLNLRLNPIAVMIAVIFSLVVGIFFGLYPASKASKLDPIDALRYE